MLEQKIYSAPSNIAIIKYMGKTNSQQNIPSNPSISYTLNHLRSFVSLAVIDKPNDEWGPLAGDNLLSIELSDKGKTKFLNHLKRLKEIWKIDSNFLVQSANNFPSDCGIASSSSSFAALTLAAVSLFDQMKPQSERPSAPLMSRLSRLGSGSSCRSFFAPWAIWRTEFAEEWDCRFNSLHHCVILLDSARKEVSSSEAHSRVITSPLFKDRLIKVSDRLNQLHAVNNANNWNRFCDLAFEEFQEMHQLFETSSPSFSYRNKHTMDILDRLEILNKQLETKLLITMDAGNNIHCLSLPQHRDELENLSYLFPGQSFLNSWSNRNVSHV